MESPARRTTPPAKPRPVELLAPAGEQDSAFAALRYGADAIYCGLPRFSARADAGNFSVESLSEIVGFGHSLTPRRRVYATVNTLIRDGERRELVRALTALCDCRVDGVIVQDAGVAAIARRHAPQLRLHASTQLAVHSREGARTLRDMGFARVVLARELTIAEVRSIAAGAGIEVEVFIHGALCYAYSGLCLFSSHATGRSGNRGRCAYCCREAFGPDAAASGLPAGRPVSGFPFSMKDLAMGPHLDALRDAGVTSLKIEGRMKSALYVAAVTDYYRRLLDGRLPDRDRRRVEDDLRTIFSRPWTDLYARGKPTDPVLDAVNIGHRGARIGQVETVRRDRAGRWLAFHTSRAMEKHDGIQVDLPDPGRPFGFAVETMRYAPTRGARPASVPLIAADAGAAIEILLPSDAPDLPEGAPVYCASSQAVKRSYPFERPRPGAFRQRRDMAVTAAIASEQVRVQARAADDATIRTEAVLEGPFDAARQPGKTESAFRQAFERTGDTPWVLATLDVTDPDGRFVPVSRIQEARRQICASLTDALSARQAKHEQDIAIQLDAGATAEADPSTRSLQWSLKFRSPTLLSGLTSRDRAEVTDAVWRISTDTSEAGFASGMESLADFRDRGALRVAVPAIVRGDESEAVRRLLLRAKEAGVARFEIANVNGFCLFADAFGADWMGRLDVTGDWPLYVTNRQAAQQWIALGVRQVMLSPEDDAANLATLLRALDGQVGVIVFQYTPLFLSETAPEVADGGLDGLRLKGRGGRRTYRTWRDGRRSVTTDERAFCLAGDLVALREAGGRLFRVDLTYAPPDPGAAAEVWRTVRSGHCPPHTHDANYRRNLM
jgi:putative protease